MTLQWMVFVFLLVALSLGNLPVSWFQKIRGNYKPEVADDKATQKTKYIFTAIVLAILMVISLNLYFR